MPWEPQFDIFSGEINKHPMWLETVEGLDRARERMTRIAAEKPGHYFVYDSYAGKVVAETCATVSKAKGHA